MKLFKIKAGQYYPEIDFIKAVAIISVVILHGTVCGAKYIVLAPLFFWSHAVPLFLILAGINSFLSAHKKDKLLRAFKRIILPFLVFWIIQVILKGGSGNLIRSFIHGGEGPGSYFVPLYIQHLLFFPVLLWMSDKYGKNALWRILALSVLLEILCVHLPVGARVYRILYVRYMFAAYLGLHIVRFGFNRRHLILLSGVSLIYILNPAVLDRVFHSSWGWHHAPAYFYTLLLLLGLWKAYPYIGKIDKYLLPIGKASYHILLVQTLYYWKFSTVVTGNDKILLNLFMCVGVGYIFYKATGKRKKNL